MKNRKVRIVIFVHVICSLVHTPQKVGDVRKNRACGYIWDDGRVMPGTSVLKM